MKIGIISDTHDLLRSEVVDCLRGCDCILHAGDISSREIVNRLEAIAPLIAVRGNNDGDWARDIPRVRDFELDGLRICMAHRKKDLPGNLDPYDLVITGHTHQYASAAQGAGKSEKETLLLNPGSCGPRMFHQPVTMAVLRTGGGSFTAERIDIAQQPPAPAPKNGDGDLRKQIETVIREMKRGIPVKEVARRNGMDTALAEKIARLYVTHPGVTPEGIMAKMGL